MLRRQCIHTSQELKQDDSEAVNIGFGGGLLQLSQFWGAVTERSRRRNHIGIGGGGHEPWQAKIGDTCSERRRGPGVEKDVGGSEVPVNDVLVLVEAVDAPSGSLRYPHPCAPIQSCFRASCCMHISIWTLHLTSLTLPPWLLCEKAEQTDYLPIPLHPSLHTLALSPRLFCKKTKNIIYFAWPGSSDYLKTRIDDFHITDVQITPLTPLHLC